MGRGEKKKKKEKHFPSRSPLNRQSKRFGAREKVGPRNESYAWVPKSEFFVKAKKGKGFLLHWFPFHLRAVIGRMVQPQPWD